jgi:hypothetical protein
VKFVWGLYGKKQKEFNAILQVFLRLYHRVKDTIFYIMYPPLLLTVFNEKLVKASVQLCFVTFI